MAKKRKKRKKCYCGIGGQAVLEGVMMKNNDRYAVAVRKPDGTIAVKAEAYQGIWGADRVAKIPFIRGVFNFVDSLVLGMKTLTWSAEFYDDGEPDKKGETAKADGSFGEDRGTGADGGAAESGNAGKKKEASGKGGEKLVMGATVAFSIVMAVAVFIVLPYFLSTLFSSYIRNASLLAILEGVLRILIFLGYVVAISAMQDIKRVYMYHGAEHKCINCIERGRELTVKNVRRSSRQHRRCGTSFLLFVMVVSVILFMFIRVDNPLLRLLLRLALVPVIAGISYEIIRLAGRSENILVRIISAPGMWLQRLTTREPDDSMIEVAIASVEAVFDWKEYLWKTFGYDVDAWEKKEREEALREDDGYEETLTEAGVHEEAAKSAVVHGEEPKASGVHEEAAKSAVVRGEEPKASGVREEAAKASDMRAETLKASDVREQVPKASDVREKAPKMSDGHGEAVEAPTEREEAPEAAAGPEEPASEAEREGGENA